MSNRLDDLMYEAGLLADGCWDEFDQYDKDAIEKFARLIVKECCLLTEEYQHRVTFNRADETIKKHFGLK